MAVVVVVSPSVPPAVPSLPVVVYVSGGRGGVNISIAGEGG